ncbi:YusW family protein [Ureibacillus chungkukjangi]|uniref:YusW family protein n=1 Tax=Ureibacillus chungkukjangi TaxID=1202712 RepID=UPI002040F776|nr:YusW family protein [Ureibacillus chungkukjangi]MCM3389495.1 YusW family protein [Ureibacillus chungkukjangi]
MKVKALLTVPLLLGVLAGCGDNDVDQDEVVTNPTPTNETTTNNADDTTTENANQTNEENAGQQQEVTSYNFEHFDLDVEYANDVSYNAEYTNTQNNITAEFEDEANKVDVSGDEAYNQISPYLGQLTFDETTEDQEVLNQVMTAFGLEDNYTEFELEVKFLNGEKKEYKFNK